MSEESPDKARMWISTTQKGQSMETKTEPLARKMKEYGSQVWQ